MFLYVVRRGIWWYNIGMVNIGNSWDGLLKDVFASESYAALREFLKSEYGRHTVYPDMHDIFNALKYTPYEKVKAVILGQDPYHGEGQAHGLCFSVKPGVPAPPSLVNIFKEIHDDVGAENKSPCLVPWAERGVLLLNTVLTVRAHQANSHQGHGWEQFTDAAIRVLNEQDRPMVFILWGRPAQAKAAMLDNKKHLILKAPHPSPLSAYRGFFGSRPFSQTNYFLTQNGLDPIDWQIENI